MPLAHFVKGKSSHKEGLRILSDKVRIIKHILFRIACSLLLA